MTRQPPIIGYVSRFSGRPGDTLGLHVSVRDARPYRVRLVRVLSADPNPAGPGVRFEDHSRHLNKALAGLQHEVRPGSYGVAPGPALVDVDPTWTVLFNVAKQTKQPQALLSHESERGCLTLSLGDHELIAEARTDHRKVRGTLAIPVSINKWYRACVRLSASREELELGIADSRAPDRCLASTSIEASQISAPSEGVVLIACRDHSSPRDHFDGRIENPAILRGDFDVKKSSVDFATCPQTLICGWDFARSISSQRINDVGPSGLHGELKNLPTRAVRGARWSGRDMRWRDAPQEYAAIHFHSDDLGDCEWPVALRFTIPDDLKSGSYAFHLSCDAGEDWIPFYILASRNGPFARLAFLAPTFTYQAYANHAFGKCTPAFCERAALWSAYPHEPEDYPCFGASTYNKHPDGSGIAFSSRLRPILNMRPAFLTSLDEKGSGLHHYAADAHLLAWLESRGIDFDVITDEDLHDEGGDLLATYASIITGTHPEYHTSQTLDAIGTYVDDGGRLAYVGGNGFYWRIGRNVEYPHAIEVRRAENGTRGWAAEPGEYYHASDGAYGGLWRNNGRPPQSLVGVGFSAQGPFEATHYRRTDASYDPAFSWIFDGVEGELIGDYGLSAGGAAGYELDRADFGLGTPSQCAILARSENTPSSFYPAVEEMLLPTRTRTGEASSALLEANMTYFENEAGGAVFSAGSITFCGSLWGSGENGSVSNILENVLSHFSEERHRRSASPPHP